MHRVEDEQWVTLLDLEELGDSLVVRGRRHLPLSWAEPWFDLEIRVIASPFRGTVSTIFTLEDLQLWRNDLNLFTAPGILSIGGGRAALLKLDVESDPSGEAVHMNIFVTSCEDDAVPRLIFELAWQSAFFEESAAKIDQLTSL